MTRKMTINMAPSKEPAVLPMGRKGTAGNTARIQKIMKATEPRTTFKIGAVAMTEQRRLHLDSKHRRDHLCKGMVSPRMSVERLSGTMRF